MNRLQMARLVSVIKFTRNEENYVSNSHMMIHINSELFLNGKKQHKRNSICRHSLISHTKGRVSAGFN